MRTVWRAWGLGTLIVAVLILGSAALGDNPAPVVRVQAEVKDGAVQLVAQANGPFDYTAYRPTENLYVLDLTGVSAADPAGARVVPSELVKSYRILSFAAGEKPVARLEVLLSEGVEPRVERQNSQNLTLLVTRVAGAAAVAAPASSRPAAIAATQQVSSAQATEATPNAIRSVHLAENEGRTLVTISGSGALHYQTLRLHNPDRVVLDFAGSRLKTAETHIPSNLEPVRGIRLSQFSPETSRIVIDLRSPAEYDIQRAGGSVTVSFAPDGQSRGAAQPAPAEPPARSATTRSEARVKPVTVAKAATAKPADVPVPVAQLPSALTQTSAALASPAARAQQQAADSMPLAAPVASASTATTTSSAGAPAAADSAQQGAATSAGRPAARYTGEPISVNLKEVDLRDFFRLIHEISGLNIVIDPSVHGTLTIVLDDVPWDQALDIVMKNNSLDKQLDGNVLRIATKTTLRKEAEEDRDLAKAKAEAADVVTTTRVLSYAKASSMVTTLKKFLSTRGDILADDRSNTLIIRDIPTTIPTLDNLIRQLDHRSQQVEIEARIVAANRNFSRELGTQLSFAGISGHSAVAGGQGTSGPVSFTPTPPVILGGSSGSGSGAPPVATNLSVGAPTSGIQYLFASPNFALDYVITALESKGVGKLLSKPKVIAQNNEKAYVKQGVKIPYQTTVNNTISIQFEDAVLELDVTPQITADGTVFMDVTVENDQIDQGIPRINNTPAIDTQSANTKVTVADGATVMIGGTIVTTQSTQIDQVPILGSLPIVGNLFKHYAVSSSSSELLFFLTPRILPI